MAEYYLDTNVVGGLGNGSSWANAFASMSAAVSGLVITEDSTLNCRGTAADTTPVVLDNMGADTYTLKIRGDNTTGKYSTSHYRMESTTGHCILSSEAYVTYENLWFRLGNAVTYYAGIVHSPGSTFSYVANIKNCGVNLNGGRGYGFYAGSGGANSVCNIENSIVYGAASGSTSAGIFVNDADVALTIKSCTVAKFTSGIGINASAGTVRVYNTCVVDTPNDFNGTFNTIDYCASNDGDGTNAVTVTQAITDLFTDPTNNDFSIKNTSSLVYNTGSASNRSAADITGYTWTTNDIGAFAWRVAGGSLVPINRVFNGPFHGPFRGCF